MSRIIESSDIAASLTGLVSSPETGSLFVITDSNVRRYVLPRLDSFISGRDIRVIEVEPGERSKSLETLAGVWKSLSDNGATRRSVMICIGGGVVTDLGGFAASTFKRGIRCINVPTTVLGAVDAAAGGKTGIDFNGLKNEIGTFASPEAVIISEMPFRTLPPEETVSGFAEIVKTAMITSEEFYRTLPGFNPLVETTDLIRLILRAVGEKERITEVDPKESGIRKILNFGHTAGHAFETRLIEKGIKARHGDAVAHGILVALILSHLRLNLPSKEIHTYLSGIMRPLFPALPLGCRDSDRIMEIAEHDKKNTGDGGLQFVLLRSIGNPVFDVPVTADEFRTALDIYLDITGK